jgi:hypothetical protein
MLAELCLFSTLLNAQAGVIKGVVLDAQTGEPLSHVRVQLLPSAVEVQTDNRGEFACERIVEGNYTLRVSTVGYRMVQQRFQVTASQVVEFRLALSPDSFQRTDTVTVRTDQFELGGEAHQADFSIKGGEVKNLASVLADDPLRAVHSLPGVSSNDDFEGRFSLHGAPFDRIGLYLDDVLLHQPFHTVQGAGQSGSIAAFSADMVESLSLQSEGYGPRYGDRTAGILDVHTRDGSRTEANVRVFAGVADAGVLAEGPLGRRQRGSWLASFRKSYLQYIVQRTSIDATMAFGFTNWQGRLSYDLGRGHSVTLSAVDGTSDFDRSHWMSQLGINTPVRAGYRFTLANLGWQYARGGDFLMSSRIAYMRERYDDTNRDRRTLGQGYYGEWVWNSNGSWNWAGGATLDFGGSVRRVRGAGFADYLFSTGRVRTDQHDGGAVLSGAYARQSWSVVENRLYVAAGVRWDRLAVNGASAASPQASAAFLPWSTGRFEATWGQYTQFPDVMELFSMYGGPRLAPERATHYTAAFEQRLGNLTRVRVQVYRRDDRDLLFRPYMEARLAGGTIVPDHWDDPLRNSLSGVARGVGIFLQRRTANRVSGWLSYTYGHARMRDAATGLRFFADQDQRHTVNCFVGYRLRPSVYLGGRWSYGSGFPVPGFFRKEGDRYFLAAGRNEVRLGPYRRADFRVNKELGFRHGKMTVYAEVVNLSNAANYRFDSYDGYDTGTGQAYLSYSKMFPILPSAGVMVEF